MKNRVEEVSDRILSAMREFAPVYGLKAWRIPPKYFVMHVVASLMNDGVIPKEGESMRNVFESNSPEITTEEATKYGDKLVAVLPELEPGEHYEIVKLSCGTGIVKHDRVTRG